MPEQRNPDIEIYIKNCELEAVVDWLRGHSKGLELEQRADNHCTMNITFDATPVAADFHTKVSGKAWSSLWIKSDASPWATDLACALSASESLNTQVRCMANSWREDESEIEQWWRIENGERTLIEWNS
ncbi:MAG: hypothetical protein ACPG4U_09205 [Pseudomonadales bacterium]